MTGASDPKYAPYPDRQAEECYHAQNHDSADLCAQWRAASAAEEAAEAARTGNLIAGGGAALSLLSVLLVLWALKQGRDANRINMKEASRNTLRTVANAAETQRALDIAARNADAVAAHVGVAKDTAQRQLRAYLTVEPKGVNAAEDGFVRFPIFVTNCGQTPAQKVMQFSRFALTEHPRDFDPEALPGGISGEASDVSFGPGVGNYLYPYVEEGFLAPRMVEVADKKLAIIHFGYIAYTDAFGEARETRFAFYHWGEELTPENSKRCRLGNTST